MSFFQLCRPATALLLAVFFASLGSALRSSAQTPAAPLSQSKAGEHASAGKEVAEQVENDWADGRWNQTEIGSCLASNLRLPGTGGTVLKGLSIKVGPAGEGTVAYDTGKAAFRGAWRGGFLKFDAKRFGILSTPSPDGDVAFVSPPNVGWQNVPVRHEALRVNGNRVVLETRVGETMVRETPWFERKEGAWAFTRSFEAGVGKTALTLALHDGGKSMAHLNTHDGLGLEVVTIEVNGKVTAVARRSSPGAALSVTGGRIELSFDPRTAATSTKLLIWSGPAAQLGEFEKLASTSPGPEDFSKLAQPGPARWLPELTTPGRPGFPTDGFAVDTLTLPYVNPWKALLFCSGVDFFRDGSAAVCTIHGDVWRVSGIDDTLRAVKWKRYATGLFQPLGLRVVDNKVYVLGRDQITILHDENGDGEADRYENFCNQIDTTTGHSFVTCLECDASGNFYYVDPDGVHRVSYDGKTFETLATGLRNPNGLGVGPEGVVTVTPQQGNWTPSSAIVEVKPGGFYGFKGPKVNPERPMGYNPPLCWLPHSFDNSSSSQVWVPKGAWGALGGQMLHFSWGRCAMMLVLRDAVGSIHQGAAVVLPVKFISGPMRGTFRPQDGSLYVAGSTGWQTSATKDGSLQRVRYTGVPPRMPVAWHAHRNGLALTFAHALDRSTAEDPGSFALHQWNYHYEAAYGSKDYSITNPDKEGRDEVEVRSAKLSSDGRTVFLETPDLHPVMQMEVKYNFRFASGASAAGPMFLTLNRLDVPFSIPLGKK